jgi:hypothetical protein
MDLRGFRVLCGEGSSRSIVETDDRLSLLVVDRALAAFEDLPVEPDDQLVVRRPTLSTGRVAEDGDVAVPSGLPVCRPKDVLNGLAFQVDAGDRVMIEDAAARRCRREEIEVRS